MRYRNDVDPLSGARQLPNIDFHRICSRVLQVQYQILDVPTASSGSVEHVRLGAIRFWMSKTHNQTIATTEPHEHTYTPSTDWLMHTANRTHTVNHNTLKCC